MLFPLRIRVRRPQWDDIVAHRHPVGERYRRVHAHDLAHHLIEVWQGIECVERGAVGAHCLELGAQGGLNIGVDCEGVQGPCSRGTAEESGSVRRVAMHVEHEMIPSCLMPCRREV